MMMMYLKCCNWYKQHSKFIFVHSQVILQTYFMLNVTLIHFFFFDCGPQLATYHGNIEDAYKINIAL